MSALTSGLDEVELSDLIAETYDCVIDPTRWEPTLDRIRSLLGCTNCILSVMDLRDATMRTQMTVGIESEWVAGILDYAADAAALMSSVPDLLSRPLDEPFIGRRDVADEVWLSNRYVREWGAPQGIVDVIVLHMMRGPGRIADIGFGRHADFGLITEREARLLRLLAPHLRRAVTISDLMDMQSIVAEALANTLDMVSAGVVLVSEDSDIMHTNRAAGKMIEAAAPILSASGRLSVPDTETARQLQGIVRTAASNEVEIGGAGIGMALNSPAGPPAAAHVLPIAQGALRSRLMPNGAAVVFVTSDIHRPSVNLEPVADSLGLSRAETRVLERLVQGDSIGEAAAALHIARTTAKTHLSRLFAKTGTKRQASLIALVNRLVPPVAPTDVAGRR